MLPCIELTRSDGAILSVPVYDIRNVIELSGFVELIRITTRNSVRFTTTFDTIVSKAFKDLVEFQDSAANNRRTAINRRYVRDVFKLGDGSAKIVLVNGESYYPTEDYDTVSPLFEATSGSGGGTGEANTASNIAGTGLFFQKTGVDLEFKGLTEGTGITFDVTDDDITINASGGGVNRSTISDSVMSMSVLYTGTVPTIVENATGDFTLTVPASGKLIGFIFIGGPGHLSGSAMKLEIIDTDGNTYYLEEKLLQVGTKAASNQFALGTFYTYDFTVGGIQFTWNNLGTYSPDGFVMMASAFAI